MARYPKTIPFTLPPPVGGLNAVTSIMGMPVTDAVVLENFLPLPDRLQTRDGAADHATGFANPVKRLWVYSAASGAESLWATTDAGVYDATTAGAIGAAVIALTDGKTVGVMFSTGASNYLFLANGVDTIKQYDGTTWTSIATFGATATSTYSFIETYRQRIFLISRNSMVLEYLAANAIAGATTTYNLGSIFRRGGYLASLGTWTIDGGSGPEDMLAIATSAGEVAVFSGADPATWALKGVYYIGRPLGKLCFFKYGGDLLFNTEAGLFPLSKALLTASIDRTQSISNKIRPIFNEAAQLYFSEDGWQMVAQPDLPLLLVNVPNTTMKLQYCMHLETGAWSIFSGWNANCFARMGNALYFGMTDKVAKVSGPSDFGGNITATCLSAYTQMKYPRKKHIKLIRPYFSANGAFSYTLGVAQDFLQNPATNTISPIASGSAALWGSGVWGTSYWTGAISILSDWRVVPDIYSVWKALYLQIISNTTQISYLGADLRVMPGSDF